MPKLRYIGPFDEVEIPDAQVVVKQGEEFDVDDAAIAKSLLEQETNYEAVKAGRK